MHTSNPYAQAGWHNPENPHSINNGTWGSQSQPQPSIFGALPSARPPSPPSTVTFHFTSLNPTILNCVVLGPQAQECFIISTRFPSTGAFTVFRDRDGKAVAFIEWYQQPVVEVHDGIVPKQTVTKWIPTASNQSYKTMEFRGKRYAWIPSGEKISLCTFGPGPSEMIVEISRQLDTFKLEMTCHAIQLGLLEVSVLATILFYSGHNFGYLPWRAP